MRRFTQADKDQISQYICDELARRKSRRSCLDRQIQEVDRQLKMEPDIYYKMMVNSGGSTVPDPRKAWMPELELPNQAQTLEMLAADALRMQAGSPWFSAHAALTDDYLDRVDFQSFVTGDRNEIPSRIDQDNANKLVQGLLEYYHRQYAFWDTIDLINIEAFKYSVGLGRIRVATKEVFLDTARGMVKAKQKIPVLVPRSIKNTFLDDSEHRMQNEGHIVGPSVIFEKTQKLRDVELAMKNGSTDPHRDDGGWFKKIDLRADKHGNVRCVEFEGDLIVQRKASDDMFLPNVIATVAIGENSQRLIRLRFRSLPFSTYLAFPYHREHVDDPYGSSPLLKGMPVQKAATDALNRTMMSAALRSEPPLGYNRDDPTMVGGPVVQPGAVWETLDGVKVHDNISDPGGMFSVYAGLEAKYADVTGVNAPRLGAQTVSHTTAFAKEAELNRGVVRTVDYVDQTNRGPLTKLLYAEYQIGRPLLGNKITDIYIDAYDGFVGLNQERLPELVHFQVFGAGGPQEEQQKRQNRLVAAQQAAQYEQLRAQALVMEQQTGIPSVVDYERIIEQIMRDGGWTDVDAILRRDRTPEITAAGGGVAGNIEGAEPAAGAALQAAALTGR